MEYAVELYNVTKKYDAFSLDQISFQVPKGTIMGFVGENGAGKTTTMKAILDLIRIDEGEIRVMGKNISVSDKSWKKDIGVVFDENHFQENLTITSIEKFLKNIYKENWDKKKFHELLTRFDLPIKKEVKEFSRGMKMKLNIAVAMSHGARLLILDEATSGIDPVSREEILELFLEFIQDEDHTVFLSSHITSDLEKVADYITFIHKGKIVFCENKDELMYQYGVVRCSKEDFDKLDKTHAVAVRKNEFGYEVLVSDRIGYERQAVSYVVDRTSIEEIILFQVKGEKIC